jgi:hypothetical protein
MNSSSVVMKTENSSRSERSEPYVPDAGGMVGWTVEA